MRPYNEYRQFTPNPEGGARSNATLFNHQQKNSECCELRTWKQSPLDSDHVLILNASLTYTHKGVYFKGLRAQLFVKWSFVLVYPSSLIRHKSKYSVIFPYLRCNISECETIIYYVNDRLCTSVAFQRWHRGGCADVWFTVFYFDKLFCQVSNAGTDVCVCVCQRDHFNCFLIPAESTLNTYCLINNASLYKGLLLFVYTHNENKIKKTNGIAFCHLSFLSVNKLSLSQKLTETYRLCYVSHCFFSVYLKLFIFFVYLVFSHLGGKKK